MSHPTPASPRTGFVERALIVVAIAVALFLAWKVSVVFVLVFGGILLAVVLHALAAPLGRLLRLSERWALAVAVALVAGAVSGVGWLVGQRMSEQLGLLVQQLPGAAAQAEAWLSGSPTGRFLVAVLTAAGQTGNTLSGLAGFATSTFGALADAVIILFLGLYLAADPHLYRDGLLRLLPRGGRRRAGAALDAAGQALQRWLFGQLIAMAAVGVVVGTGLALLGMPLALALGLLAALLEFVPFIGPIVFSIPGILLAFAQGPVYALWIALFYLVVQQLEGNLLMPILQRWVVAMPPALGVIAVVVFGLLFGPVGVLFATPLMVVVMVLVQKLYVEAAIENKGPDSASP